MMIDNNEKVKTEHLNVKPNYQVNRIIYAVLLNNVEKLFPIEECEYYREEIRMILNANEVLRRKYN